MKKSLLFALLFYYSVSSQNAWYLRDSFPSSKRAWPAVFTLGNYAYLVGGSTNNLQYKNDVWRYDGVNDQWTQLNNFPPGIRAAAHTFTIAGRGYLVGGFANGGIKNCNDLWEYDPAQNSWQQKDSFPGFARSFGISFSIGNFGYYGTGTGQSGLLNDFWKYDAIADSWTQLNNFPSNPICGMALFKIGGTFYAGLGFASPGVTQKTEMYEYNPANDTWLLKGATNFSTTSTACFSIGNKGYIGTGGVAFMQSTQDLRSYDPVTNTFNQELSFPGTARNGAIAFSIGSSGYMGLGDMGPNNNYRLDLYEYRTGIPTEIKNNFNDEFFQAYPNPTKDKLFFVNVPSGSNLQIVDLYGKKIFDLPANSSDQIDLSALENGVYFLMMEQTDESHTKTFRKIIKQ